MGCHTWFWKPTSKTREQLRDETLVEIQKKIRKYNDPDYIEYLLIRQTSYPFTKESIKELADYWEKWFIRISSDKPIWQAAIYSNQIHYRLTEYKDSVFYEEYPLHDLFRYGRYDTPNLHSVEEVLDFCDTHDIELGTNALLRLYYFFYSAPTGGLITFG